MTIRFSQYFWLSLALLGWALAGLVAPCPASAQQPVLDGMPVRVGNREIISLRGPIAGYTARQRATNTMQRIERALERSTAPEISTLDGPEGTRVLMDGEPVFVVTRVDVDEQIGETTPLVARESVRRLKSAIRERREQEKPTYIMNAAAYALGATLLYGFVLSVLRRLTKLLGTRVSTAAEARAQKLQVGGVSLLQSDGILLLTRRLVALCAWLAAGFATSVWLTFVLVRFPYSRPWGEQLESHLLGMLTKIALAMLGAVPGLVFVALIFLVARGIIRIAVFFLERAEQETNELGWMDHDSAKATRRIVSLVIWVFALAMAYPYLPGADSEAFQGLSVLVGLMVSIGGASLVGQGANGLTLMYSRAFRRGDYVRIGDVEGTVVEIGMFATRLRTSIGEQLMLPSSTVMSTTTKNFSRVVANTAYVLDTTVTIGYATPWRQVHAMLEEAARRTAGLAKTPAPLVRQTALSDFYIEYKLAAYTPLESPHPRAEVLNELHAHIQDVFNEFGVQIMSPHYEGEPNQPQVVPKQGWYAAPALAPTPVGQAHTPEATAE